MKVIKLTESDLIRIVKKVMNESTKKIVNEQFSYGGVKISPSNDGKGNLILSYNGQKTKYKVNVDVKKLGFTVYNGPIAVVALWKSDKGYFAKDNTGKVFELSQSELNKMVTAAKSNTSKIQISGTGEIAGITGNYTGTLTKTA